MPETRSLLQRLQAHSRSGPYPFHTPGHKRNEALAPYLAALGAALDVTELPGFDDLHAPEDVLAGAMDRCARLCGADQTFFLVGGATAGLLAGIRAATAPGDTVLLGRNCHKAVYHALELCALRPVYLLPNPLPEFEGAGPIAPETVDKALQEQPQASLLVLTSPTYEGILSDIPAIAALCRARDVPLLVDEAHGAHLGHAAQFPPSALRGGADLVVQSYHKTLPSLTQSAVLHLQGGRISRAVLARNLGIFQSSSPSYLLLASLDGCVRLLEEEGAALFADWSARLGRFYEQTAGLQWLRVLGDIEGVLRDPSKLLLSTRRAGLSGPQLMERLAGAFGLQLEMAMGNFALALTGLGDTDAGFQRLAAALLALDRPYGPPRQSAPPPALPEQACPLAEALRAPMTLRSGRAAAGAVSAAYLWAYPPGIPLLVPGERISRALLEQLSELAAAGVRLLATAGNPPESFAVLR